MAGFSDLMIEIEEKFNSLVAGGPDEVSFQDVQQQMHNWLTGDKKINDEKIHADMHEYITDLWDNSVMKSMGIKLGALAKPKWLTPEDEAVWSKAVERVEKSVGVGNADYPAVVSVFKAYKKRTKEEPFELALAMKYNLPPEDCNMKVWDAATKIAAKTSKEPCYLCVVATYHGLMGMKDKDFFLTPDIVNVVHPKLAGIMKKSNIPRERLSVVGKLLIKAQDEEEGSPETPVQPAPESEEPVAQGDDKQKVLEGLKKFKFLHVTMQDDDPGHDVVEMKPDGSMHSMGWSSLTEKEVQESFYKSFDEWWEAEGQHSDWWVSAADLDGEGGAADGPDPQSGPTTKEEMQSESDDYYGDNG